MATTVADHGVSMPTVQVGTRSKSNVGPIIGRIAFWALVIFLLVYTIFPFYWMAISSLKPDRDLYVTPANYLPNPISWTHMGYVLNNGDFLKALRNSAIVSLSTVLLALVIGSSAAYAIGRISFRGRIPVMYIILSMTMFPQIAILGSLYNVINKVHLFNRIPALTLSYLIFTLPFTVWVLSNFFRAMPRELEEAALVDGATSFQAFYRILMPLALPGLVTTGLLAFIAAWNEFLFAVTFTQDTRARTAPVAIASFSGNTQFDFPWGNIMAAAVIVTVPLVVLVLVGQRKILAGLTAGAVKG
jgi:trehalose/maltose transport system permease protein